MLDESSPCVGAGFGDLVLAADLRNGEPIGQPVTAVHANVDTELTDVTIGPEPLDATAGQAAPDSAAVLKTPAHHPFWDATTQAWVFSADLKPGISTVAGPDGEIQYVHATCGRTIAASA